MRRVLRGAAAIALTLLASLTAAQDIQASGTRFHFASAAETRRALVSEDVWLSGIGAFHRAATAGRPVTRAQFNEFLQTAALDCNPAAIQGWEAAIKGVAPRFEELGLRLPPIVTIACTNGADASGAPYTRGDAVFMPSAAPVSTGLVAHELFHIWSRAHPSRASRLYAELGYTEAPPLAWPAEWLDARILNPDAPFNRHTIRIEANGATYSVMPLLVARRTVLQPGETFFDVADVRLLAVEPAADGKSSVAARRDGQLVWFDANTNASYLRQLGGNTGYVIHAEETTADNIAILVTGRPARNAALIERMRQVLLQLKANSP